VADRAFTSLVPRLQASVPGCPQATIAQYIRDAAIRTCERTLLWRYQVPLFNLLPGVSEYVYNKPDNTDVHAVFEALINGYPLDRLTLEKAIELFPQWADLYSGASAATVWGSTPPTSTFGTPVYDEVLLNDQPEYVIPAAIIADASTPQAITQITPDKYIVLPLPGADETYQMRMFVALKPKKTATGMSEAIFDDIEEVIMHGALQHLLVLPAQAWSDRELAAYHAKQYLYQVSERRARANLGNVRGTVRARMQPFGA